MRDGYSFESFAGLIGVSRKTIYNWVDDHAEFAEAKEEASELCRLFWEKLGIVYVVSQTENFGKNEGSKSTSLNAATWIFNMKNRFPREWREKTEVDQTAKIELTAQDSKVVEEMLAKTSEFIERGKK
jgi:DNA-binding XRE family transcriptional regulator